MRVTDRIIFERGSSEIAGARQRAEAAQRVASTGLRVEAPGDDAGAAGILAAAPLAEARFRAIGAAAAAASDELQAADTALGGIATALSHAHELAIQLANGNYGAAERAAGAGEVDGLAQQIVGQLNTRVGGRYLFSGAADGQQPFDPQSLTYAGDAQRRSVEIAPGVFQASSVAADVAMGQSAQGGVDVLGTLRALSAALTANDAAGVQATLDGLASSIEQLGSARTEAGVAMGAFDASSSASRAAADDVKARASHLSDADVVSAATQLAFTQTALQASMAATAQGFKLSLVDYLR